MLLTEGDEINMSSIEHTVSDLINFSSSQQPIDFKNAFDSMITKKIETAIIDKKIEVAKSMYNTHLVDTEEQETNYAEAT